MFVDGNGNPVVPPMNNQYFGPDSNSVHLTNLTVDTIYCVELRADGSKCNATSAPSIPVCFNTSCPMGELSFVTAGTQLSFHGTCMGYGRRMHCSTCNHACDLVSP